jgi:hypothetical protein
MPRARKKTVEDLPESTSTATIEPDTDQTNQLASEEMAETIQEEQTLTEEGAGPKVDIVKHERLVGAEMLQKLSSLGQEADQEEAFRACGYYSEVFEDGQFVKYRYQEKPFWAAFAAASQGITFATKTRGGGAGRPKRPYVKVAKDTLRIVLGGHFAEQAGFAEHQKVKVTAANGSITITPWVDADEDSDYEDDEDL